MAKKRVHLDLDEALRLYNDASIPFKEKAKILGTSPDTLRKFLRENGVDIPTKKGNAASKLSIEKVTELYVTQNMSRKDTAKALGVSLSTVARFIEENKIVKDNAKIVELREQTMMERYGVKHALDSDEFKEKAKETCRENFGVDYPMQSSEVMEKSRETSLKNWGTERPQQSDKYQELHRTANNEPEIPRYSDLTDEEKAEVQAQRSERRKKTNLERYGVENPSQVSKFKDKARETTRERYGDSEFFRTDTFKKRSAETSLERYGTTSPIQSDEVKAKAKATNLERYGTDCALQNPQVRAKTEQTNLERYGNEIPMRTEAIQQKYKDTMTALYGADNPSKIAEFQEKKRETSRERYGVNNYSQQYISHVDEWDDADLFRTRCKQMAEETGRKPHAGDLEAYFNVGPTAIYAKIRAFECSELINMTTSYVEDRWRDWMKSEGIACSERPERCLISEDGRPLEIDIYVPDHALGIEIDPTSTHNSTVPYYNGSYPKSPSYHQRKTELAEQAGLNLVHIYDFDDEEKMRSLIRSLCQMNERIYARNTVCAPVDAKAERKFLEQNHIQGYVKSEKAYGLFSKDEEPELLAIMTFGIPRYGTKDEKTIRWELLRFCSKDGITVVGGASKLFKAFVRECAPESVLSYANYDIGNGNMYEALGFEYTRTTNPSYTWVKLDDPSDTYSWYVVNAKGFDNLFGTDFGKGASNKELMEQAGYVQVYNSGNKVYIWNSPK